MHIEGILRLQLHNLNFPACIDRRHSLGREEEKKTNKPHGFCR